MNDSADDLKRYPPALRSIVEDFRASDSFETRLQLLLDFGRQFQPLPATIAATPYPSANKVPACESDAYLFATPLPGGTLRFNFAVENPQGVSAKALAVILDQTLSGKPLVEVAAVPEDVIYEFFGNTVSMGKGLGLMGMIQMVRAEARSRLDGTGI